MATKSKLQLMREKKKMKDLIGKRLELSMEQIRNYSWGTKEFQPKVNKATSQTVKELKKQKYWLVVQVKPMSKIVDDVYIISKDTLESERLIPMIQYIHSGAKSDTILKIKKKKLLTELEEYDNKVRFV